jgi:hypothetical protein
VLGDQDAFDKEVLLLLLISNFELDLSKFLTRMMGVICA